MSFEETRALVGGSLDQYLDEINTYPLIDREAEARLAQRIQPWSPIDAVPDASGPGSTAWDDSTERQSKPKWTPSSGRFRDQLDASSCPYEVRTEGAEAESPRPAGPAERTGVDPARLPSLRV